MPNTAVEMRDIVKVYPNGIVANEGINFEVQKGEIHALVGENGAGKSTLMKILFGIEQPTSGQILVDEKPVTIQSVSEAMTHGLGMVQQHFMLVPSMTVAENIVLGAEPTRSGLLNREEAVNKTQELCKKYSFDIDVNSRIDALSVGNCQKVEILKVLYRQANVLILDEPTAVLTPQETEELFRQLKVLKDEGHTIVFISHKLHEVEELCDRVTIMRRGKTVGTRRLSEITIEQISDAMMGQQMSLKLDKSPAKPGDICLDVKNVSYVSETGKKVVDNVSFGLREGEILGIVGVENNGQSELVEMITGFEKPLAGSISINNNDIGGKSVSEIRNLSVGYIPQERMSTGVAQDCSITENMSSVAFKKDLYSTGPFVKWKELAEMTKERIDQFKIKTGSEKTTIGMLSGGNIQKVVVAREMMGDPDLIVAEQPTRGIDVGAASLIHHRLVDLRDKGSAVLLISSDLGEVLSLSDSLIVMYGGKIAAYFPEVTGLTEKDLGFYMLGIKNQTEEEIVRCQHA